MALESEPLGDTDNVDELPFLGELLDRDLLAELHERERAPLLELLPRDADLEERRRLRRRPGDQGGLGVHDEANLVGGPAAERAEGFGGPGRVGRDAAKKVGRELRGPDLRDNARAVRVARVEAGGDDAD